MATINLEKTISNNGGIENKKGKMMILTMKNNFPTR
jgi:hypothetical protein